MDATQYADKAATTLKAMRDVRPLVHNITNYVVMNFSANVLLAAGASPIMAHAMEEMEEMAAIAGALAINIGTLSGPWIESMVLAGKTARKLGKPVLLDPVGAGASKLRTEAAWRIIREAGVSVIRGNASEIMALMMADAKTRGVDASHGVDEAVDVARDLARQEKCVVAVTGAVDMVTDGATTVTIANGHPLMGLVTGTGCSATSTMGAFLAMDDDPVSASVSALAFYGLAGEKAAARASSPGSFQTAFVDSLYELDPETLQAEARIQVEE